MARRVTRRYGRMLLIAGIAAVTLSGCSLQPHPEIPRNASRGGQTQAQLDARLATIDGLTVTNASGSKPNARGFTGYGFDLELQPGYRIADPAVLVDFLVESAWSVRDGWMPNATVEIRLFGDPAEPVDLVEAAQEAGWVPPSLESRGPAANGFTDVSIWVTVDTAGSATNGGPKNRARLGAWPSDAPAVPSGMVVVKAANQ